MKPRVVIRGVPDEQTRAELEEIQRILDANPLEGYFPHPKQVEFHSARTRIKALIAGNRVGKSSAMIVDNLIQALDLEDLPEHLRPFKRWGLPGMIPFRGRILSPGLTRTMEGVIFEKIREYCPPAALRGGSWQKAYDKANRVLHFESGAWIDFLTYEQDLQAHSGVALHRVSYDEEPPGDRGEAIRKESRTRLIDYGGDEVFAFTPLLGFSFAHREIWKRRDDPEITVVQASMDDNPYLSETEREQYKEGLTEEEYRARIEGEFVHFEGMVYGEFSPRKHVLKERPPAEHVRKLEIMVGIDPGIRTTGIIFGGFDGENSLLLFDELYLHDAAAIPEIAAESIKAKLMKWGSEGLPESEHKMLPVKYFLIDPSARNRQLSASMEGVQAAYHRAGIPALEAQADRQAGIFEMKRRMQHDPTLIVVSPELRWWLFEIENYRATEKSDGSFDVVKKDDHLMDASRWLAMARPVPVGAPVQNPKRRRWHAGTAPAYESTPSYGPPSPMGALG